MDRFRYYNDTYGHQAGDQVLQAVAAHLKLHARGGDAIIVTAARNSCVSSPNSHWQGDRSSRTHAYRLKNIVPSSMPLARSECLRSASARPCLTGTYKVGARVVKEADEALLQSQAPRSQSCGTSSRAFRPSRRHLNPVPCTWTLQPARKVDRVGPGFSPKPTPHTVRVRVLAVPLRPVHNHAPGRADLRGSL